MSIKATYEPRDITARSHSLAGQPVTRVHLTVDDPGDYPYVVEWAGVEGATTGGRGLSEVRVDTSSVHRGQDSLYLKLWLDDGNGTWDKEYNTTFLSNNEMAVPLFGYFTPPSLGPYAAGLVNGKGERVSNRVRSMGLPRKEHTSFRIKFGNRGDVLGQKRPEPVPTKPPGTATASPSPAAPSGPKQPNVLNFQPPSSLLGTFYYNEEISKGLPSHWVVQPVQLSDVGAMNVNLSQAKKARDAGHTVIVRFVWGYHGAGTIPPDESKSVYFTMLDFAVEKLVEAGVQLCEIGNEPYGMAWEWPNNTPITWEQYRDVYRRGYAVIAGRMLVSPAAVAPYNDVPKDELNWVERQVRQWTLPHEWRSIHVYGRPGQRVSSDLKMEYPYGNFHNGFRVYRDYLNASNATRPVVITECNPMDWAKVDGDWIKGVGIEIKEWNGANPDNPISGVCFYECAGYDKKATDMTQESKHVEAFRREVPRWTSVWHNGSRVDPRLKVDPKKFEPVVEPVAKHDMSSVFWPPMKDARITQHFIGNEDLYDVPGSNIYDVHTGLDLWSNDAAVHSVFAGEVAYVDHDASYGNYVRVYSEQRGLHVVYAHLAGASVKVGQQVKAGDVVGRRGNTGGHAYRVMTGQAMAAHLHLEFRATTKDGKDYARTDYNPRGMIDPLVELRRLGVEL